jgi:predicted ribosome quality control (RQC) complex YloA/Tae2 family protein
MRMLAGATVMRIHLVDPRVLRIDALTRDEDEVAVTIAVFGAAGSAVLTRGETVVESVGKGRLDVPTSSAVENPAPSLAPPLRLVVRGNLGGAAPWDGETEANEPRVLGPFDGALNATRAVGRLVLEGAHAAILHRVTRPLRRKRDALAKLSINLEEDIVRAAQHGELRREAETLAAFQTHVPAGVSSIELPDVYDASLTRTIALDPSEAVHVQVEKRFRRAAKLERSAAFAERRLGLVRNEHSELGAALALLEQSATFNDALKTIEAIRAKFDIEVDAAPRPAGAPKKREPEKSYRSIDVDPGWFALVGRSNFENDEITFQVAKPTDLWFHAQGVPGSHVVLRSRGGSEGPPGRIIERTASIAAHFSKAKHSSLVPVIYTQRKYVRKFRGAKPGEVTCEREKMIMVPPALPENSEA